MNKEQIKNYLQTYLDTIITPTIENLMDEDPIDFLVVHDVIKGSFQPPVIHVFIDTNPIINEKKASNYRKLRKLDKDIEDFFNYLTIKNKIKIHWNKRPYGVEEHNREFTIS